MGIPQNSNFIIVIIVKLKVFFAYFQKCRALMDRKEVSQRRPTVRVFIVDK